MERSVGAAWGAGLVALGAIVAMGLRVRGLDPGATEVVTDTLHPWLRALQIQRTGHLPWHGAGSNFHYGVLQAYLRVPLVALASGLRDLARMDILIQSLGILAVGLAGFRLGAGAGPSADPPSPGLRIGTGLLAAGLYACWPVLLDHAWRPAFTYHAPAWIGVSLLLACHALSRPGDAPARRAWVGAWACQAVAVHEHPYALAILGGSLVLAWRVRRDRATLLAGGLTVTAVLLPMAADNLWVFWVRTVSGASTRLDQDPGMAGMSVFRTAGRALSEGAAGWPGPVVWLALALPLLAVAGLVKRRERDPAAPLLAWFGLSWVFLLGLGKALGYLQPYHVAVVLPLHILLGARVLAWILCRPFRRARPWHVPSGVLATGSLALVLSFLAARGVADRPWWWENRDMTRLGTVEEGVAALRADAGDRPRTLALVSEVSLHPVGDPVAWFLEMWLAGDPDTLFPAHVRSDRPRPRAWVAADLSQPAWEEWGERPLALLERPTGQETTLRLLPFPDTWAASRWLGQGCALSGSRDLKVFGPKEGMGGVAGLPEDPDAELHTWARLCPEDPGR